MNEEMTLEDAFGQLEEITKKMEQGNLSLEETFSLYKQGLELAQLCNDKIEKVETEIRILNDRGEADE